MAQACARVDSGLDKAKISSDRSVDADRLRLRAVLGGGKTFLHSLDPLRTCRPLALMSAFRGEADQPSWAEHVCKWQILLQKSFWSGERKFLGLLMRFMRSGVRDHIVSSKIDQGPS